MRESKSITSPLKNTVLVVEDDAAVRSVVAKVVKHLGFDALVASDGAEAVHVFSERSTEIVAVVLDLMMPDTDGRETLAMISAFAPTLPVVIATALPLPLPDNFIGRQPGSKGVGYIQKPFTPADLGAELMRVIAEERE